MSDFLTHECGVAMVRLKKPLSYYHEKYGTALHGLHKLFLLLEKQHNRGQDGIGIGCCKIDIPLGKRYMFRERSAKSDSLQRVFTQKMRSFNKLAKKGILDPNNPKSIEQNFDFGGQILMGHLRYGTSGVFGSSSCHPYIRRSNWQTRTCMVMGNFNMTNTAELNSMFIKRGQHPIFDTDTQTVLEEIGYHLDESHTDIYRELRDQGIDSEKIPSEISKKMDISDILEKSARAWDGGYVIIGSVGNGSAFIVRDPKGIRPCHYFENDELIAVASERVALATAFDLEPEDVAEFPTGHSMVITSQGESRIQPFTEEQEKSPCSFERIYFSRGNDPEIYQERKQLGALLVPQIADVVGGDSELAKAVFSFVPNTAEVAYYGLMEGLRWRRRTEVKDQLIKQLEEGSLDSDSIESLIMEGWPVGEKVAAKDVKMRTFISQEKGRNQLVSHVYDITYGTVPKDGTLVVIDDSIVRGTTLKKSILRILSRTGAGHIVIVSTAPQIRYPDCYGIDMSELGKFIAFQATVELLRERDQLSLMHEIEEECREELKKPVSEMKNVLCKLYENFSDEEISAKISELVFPTEAEWDGKISIIYQTVNNLTKALPDYGNWYFTGNYPTPGGNRIANQSFLHYMEDRDGRPYDLFQVDNLKS